MKTFLLKAFAFASVSLFAASLGKAQEPVSTGILEAVSAKEGTVTIRSDQTHGDLTLFGLEHATIFTADGKPLTIADLQQGQMVTIAYAARDKRWFISKVILSEPRPAVTNRNMTPDEVQRIREATEGTTRTPSAEDKPAAASPAQPVQATPGQSNTTVSVPLRRTIP